MVSKRKKIINIIGCFVVFFVVVFFVINKIYTMKNNIDYILKSEPYSYLPLTAQNYIKEVYMETNEVILTEKNKVANMPYLNPQYVEYLNMASEEQSEVTVIPDETLVDYAYVTSPVLLNENEIPASFDLRNVNGKNFVTPIKNQGGLGLCWVFATNAQVESLLLVQSDKSFTNDAQIFSERQIDYATADNGITDGKPIYSYNRILGDGGTFKYATSVMVDSLGLFDNSWSEYDDNDVDSREKHEVYNFNNSLYEVTKTVIYPDLDLSELNDNNSEHQILRNNYLNNLKSLIMKYGGSYISTVDPSGRCSVSINGSRFMYDDGICASAGHAMQVIGWDDNYEYSVCTGTKDKSGYYHINKDVNNCGNGKVVTEKGAWILKNSWGGLHDYVYIAYDSKDMVFNLTTELSQKDWDNYYSANKNLYDYGTKTVTKAYEKKSQEQEFLKKIKFNANTQNTVYNIYVAVDSEESYVLYDTVTSDFPGVYTIDLSDKNIYLYDETFFVKIVSNTGTVSSGVSVYTDNVEDNYQITSHDVKYENSLTNIDKYVVRITSETVSIPENDTIDYKILDENREEITSNYTYSENKVFANNVFSKIIIDSDLDIGTYIVQSIYNGKVLDESKIIIDSKVVVVEGKGTSDNPYIITNPAQLNLVRKDAFAFYELGNDIDLTYDTTNENGLFYNDGKGWDPIKYSDVKVYTDSISATSGFSGGFDGKNYKIIGLNINRPDESSIGLFANTYNLNFSNLYIKNLVLDNPNIVGKNFVGGVVGYVNGTTYERCLNISNIAINGGKIVGINYVGGIIGYLRAGSYLTNYYVGGERHLIDSLYNSATIEANDYAGGIFGYVTNISGYKQGNSIFKISNVLNKGNVTSSNHSGGIAGFIRTRENNYITIYNSINTGKVKGEICSGGITCELSSASLGNLNLTNIYYIDDDGIRLSNKYVVVNNVSKKTISELTDINSYTEWNNFNTYWEIETVNDVKRMPILKFMNFNYTELEDFSIKVGEEVSINNYIKPNMDAAYNIDFKISDEQIASLDNGVLKGKNQGSTKLHFVSYYDGYEGDILLTVFDSNKVYYHSNDEENNLVTQNIEENNFKLNDNQFTRLGYLFKNWNTDKDGSGISYTNNQEVNLTSDLTLYAQWEPIKYSIVFNANGATGTMNDINVLYDQNVKLPSNMFTLEKYIFKEWNTKRDGTGTSYQQEQEIKSLTSVDNDVITLYAIWEKKIYNVIFDANDGKFSDNKTTYVIENWDDSKLDNIIVPIREGYTFKGYFTDTIGDTSLEEYIAEFGIDKDGLIFYAIWDINKYNVEFNSNGGKGTMLDQIFMYSERNFLSNNKFTRDGYTFKEWNTKRDGTGNSYQDKQIINVSEDMTLYAIWDINKYNVEFNSNGGKGTMLDQIFMYSEKNFLSNNKFTRDGYTFKEWNTKRDGTGNSYQDKQIIKVSEDMTLYAIWEESYKYIINKYSYDESNKYISSIMVNTTVDEFKKNIQLNSNYKIHVESKNIDGNEMLYTGSKTKIYNTNGFEIMLINIVSGDINGDGAINSGDLLRLRQHLIGTKNISGEYYISADITYDKAVNSGDLLRLRQHLIGTKPIE